MTNAIMNKLRFVIETSLKKKVQIAMPGVFPTWDKFLDRLCAVSGIIQATPQCPLHHITRPTISIYIDPTGDVQVSGAYDKIEA